MDRILGPAYPALLAPGLRVVHGVAGAGTVVATGPLRVVFDAGPGVVLACDGSPDLAIDYADPHTRDRVARALHKWAKSRPGYDHADPHDVGATVCWYDAAWTAWTSDDNVPRGADWLPGAWLALRAVAAAVWGGA